MLASAISAVDSSRAYKLKAAKQAHNIGSFINLHNLIAFFHLFFSQNVNNIPGY